MFSVDDSFEFDDEAFAKVAEGLEVASEREEPPAKRRSFELGFAPDSPHRPLLTKENCQPVKTFHHINSTSPSPSSAATTLHKGFQFTKPSGGFSAKKNENPTPAVPYPTNSGLLAPAAPQAAIGSNAQRLGGTATRVDSHLQKSQTRPFALNRDPFPSDEFGDLDDLDLDIDLDDPTPWAPVPKLDRPNVTAPGESSQNAQSSSCNANGTIISKIRDTNSDERTFLRPAVSTLRQPVCSSATRTQKDASVTTSEDCSTRPSASPSVVPPRNNVLTPRRTEIQNVSTSSTPVSNIGPSATYVSKGQTDTLSVNSEMRQQFSNSGQVTPLSTSPEIAFRSDSTPGSSVSSVAQSLQSTRSAKSAGSKRKRKFPGPAGLLPRLKPGMDLDEVKPVSPATPKSTAQKKQTDLEADLPNSQSGDEVFHDAPWRQMKKELESQAGPILEAFSLSAVMRKAGLKQLPRGKVPIVCCSIDGLQIHSADASAVLRDPSGQMKGTIHRQLVKEHGAWLAPGTVLVLRQVGVFSPSARNHYLNITPSNVVRLYVRAVAGEVTCHRLSAFTEEDFIMPVVPLNRTLSEPGAEQQSVLQPLVNRQGQQGPRSVFSVVPPTGSSPHYPPTGGRYGEGRGRGRGAASPLVNQGRGRGLGPYQRPQWTSSPRPPPTTPTAGPGGPSPRTFNFRQSSPSPRPAPPRGVGPRPGGAPRGPTGQSPGTRGGYGHAPRPPPVAGPTGPRGPSPAIPPAGLPRSAEKPDQRANIQDMWGDDQLEDLLTGIEDEMLADF